MPSIPDQTIFARRAVVVEDIAIGTHKAERLRRLARIARAKVGPRKGDGLVYLRRGDSGAARALANEKALVDALTARGFEVVDTEATPLEELLRRLRDAEVVVSMEGSHLTHAHLMMKEGGVLLVINPFDRFVSKHLLTAFMLGARPATVIAEHAGGDGLYHVDVGDLFRTLDLAHTDREARRFSER